VLYNKRLQPSKALVTVLAKDLNCFATALQGQVRAKQLSAEAIVMQTEYYLYS